MNVGASPPPSLIAFRSNREEVAHWQKVEQDSLERAWGLRDEAAELSARADDNLKVVKVGILGMVAGAVTTAAGAALCPSLMLPGAGLMVAGMGVGFFHLAQRHRNRSQASEASLQSLECGLAASRAGEQAARAQARLDVEQQAQAISSSIEELTREAASAPSP